MKTSQDEKSEETFKIDYGKLNQIRIIRKIYCVTLYKLLQSSTTMISDGLVDLAQRESISSMQSNTSDDNLSWLLNYKITNV